MSTHDELPVLLLQSLVALPQLVGHQLVLIPLLLTGVQLLRQDEESLLLTLQLPLTHQELQTPHTHHHRAQVRDCDSPDHWFDHSFRGILVAALPFNC